MEKKVESVRDKFGGTCLVRLLYFIHPIGIIQFFFHTSNYKSVSSPTDSIFVAGFSVWLFLCCALLCVLVSFAIIPLGRKSWLRYFVEF